jgi:hypothetical protein
MSDQGLVEVPELPQNPLAVLPESIWENLKTIVCLTAAFIQLPGFARIIPSLSKK